MDEVILSLSDWAPTEALYYEWNYSWSEILKFYQRKQREWAERKEMDYEFLVQLAQAALGGKKKEDEYTLDTGEGLDELDYDKIAGLKLALGSDFKAIYPQYADYEDETA